MALQSVSSIDSKMLVIMLLSLSSSMAVYSGETSIFWVRNGDDRRSLSVPIQIQPEYDEQNDTYIEPSLLDLKCAILLNPAMKLLYDSTDSFNVFHSELKLDDDYPLALLNFGNVLECRMEIAEVYRIRRLRNFRVSQTKSATVLGSKIKTNTDLGIFKRVHVTGEDTQSFIELGVQGERSSDILTFALSDEEFEKKKVYYHHNRNKNGICFDVYKFEQQNLFHVSFKYESTVPDGLYYRMDYNESGCSFHRFTMVSTAWHAFMIQKDTDDGERVAKLTSIKNDTLSMTQINITLSHSAHMALQIITIQKLTNVNWFRY